jgi:hypothetical protein
MTQDDLPAGEMKYSFKAHVQAHGFAGDLIISSTTVNDLVKSIKLLEHARVSGPPTPDEAQPAPWLVLLLGPSWRRILSREGPSVGSVCAGAEYRFTGGPIPLPSAC